MTRLAALVATVMLSTPALAVTFEGDGQGQIEFVTPSNNIGCIYTPAGGTDTYVPSDGGPELSCDRVEPAYTRVVLGRSGKPSRITNVGDASCCGAENVLSYGDVWTRDGFTCRSLSSGLKCSRGSHGFSISRKKISTY